MGSPQPPQLETVAEAARRLAVDPLTVRRMIRRGELESVRVGSRLVRVRSTDIDALIAGRAPR
jgi:excisionase family DNA binding protein